MLSLVWERRPTYNNNTEIAKSTWITYLKLLYYTWFAIAYGLVGSMADLVMVNSTWTYNHIHSLWRGTRKHMFIVYPPCDTTELISNEKVKRENWILSIAQFRPEKDHKLQLQSFATFLKQYNMDTRLILIGSCRNDEDQERVNELRLECRKLNIESRVDFVVNAPYDTLKDYLNRAAVGIHTMWNEHFGIGVVEMMAAGLITIAHNSGGPASDIVDLKEPTGYLATSKEEYAAAMHNALQNGPESPSNNKLRQNAQRSVNEKFSNQVFIKSFQESVLASKILD